MEIVGVAPGVLAHLPALFYGENPTAQLIQEIPVVGHGDDGPGEALQIIFQHRHGGNVQVVGRLVQQKHIGSRGQNPQQEQPPLLAAGKPADEPVLHGAGEEKILHELGGGEHALRSLDPVAEFLDVLQGGEIRVHLLGVLGEVAQLYRLTQGHRAGIRGNVSRDQV